MKTETKSLTPADAGLSLAILSGPRGYFADDWQAIEYTVELSNARRQVIWTGSYKLGIGHIKVPTGFISPMRYGLTEQETRILEAWQSKPHATFKDKAAQANLAAKIARVQKVTPKLDDVCSSLLMDGSAFFDGQRFEDWAGELGYSSDSIKAKETFGVCDRIGRDLSRALSRDELAGLREWASQY